MKIQLALQTPNLLIPITIRLQIRDARELDHHVAARRRHADIAAVCTPIPLH